MEMERIQGQLINFMKRYHFSDHYKNNDADSLNTLIAALCTRQDIIYIYYVEYFP